MDNNVPLAIIKGPAGTAKTFYSLAVGLHKTYTHNPKNKEYRNKIIYDKTYDKARNGRKSNANLVFKAEHRKGAHIGR